MSDSEQNKSEQATEYKLAQARKKGMLARSQELGIVISIAAFAGYLWARGEQTAARFAALGERALGEAGTLASGSHAVLVWLGTLMSRALEILLPLIGVAVGGALVAALAQTGFLFAPGAFKADFSRLNPAQGLKRLFSLQVLIEAAKACVKMSVYCAIAWLTIFDTVRTAAHSALQSRSLPQALGDSGLHLIANLLIAAAIFAALDQIIVRRLFARQMRMSRHEVKQEFKQREGDPRIKQRRKQLQRELLKRSQSMRGMRGADVLVTNPTHYAVGLKYEPESMSAPTVVARGAGNFALRLRKLAFIYGVPVIESPALARQLFHKAALEREIPAHLFRDAAAVYLRARRAPSQTRTP
ncbi:EscU/YscU/HrcU family type III secretion system export apparatus switch protein [Trinickia terrae]|uniref:EscU/YscU/HrcU family type III secretion system export apparatus switch protein n=1 Tax=Trinickia terrae TaxID=2571161 RepID=A0A4U1I7T3_9BURK|nr:EscU/YscU/HrcU family type III secretion system export apparatus switch protein [Trinickia terrae]TKC89469.1 EscU/YscU/HrcU family type III secretion system export apparatus switch protein [Trinickia terrae]